MEMLSKLIKIGTKLELESIRYAKDKEQENKIYKSEVYDIISEERLEVTMPMESTKLILLPVDGEYDMTFYALNGTVYQCLGRVIDRYKSNNVYILVFELITNLRKFQRREFYRYSCALEMCARNLEEEEIKAIEAKEDYYLSPGLPLKRSVIVDISGGGLRFMSDQRYEPGSMLYCTYHLMLKGVPKYYEIVGKVLSVKPVDSKPGVYEHRVQYVNIPINDREEIIKYIFEEERKTRNKEWNKS